MAKKCLMVHQKTHKDENLAKTILKWMQLSSAMHFSQRYFPEKFINFLLKN
jgi:hypothetical protein